MHRNKPIEKSYRDSTAAVRHLTGAGTRKFVHLSILNHFYN